MADVLIVTRNGLQRAKLLQSLGQFAATHDTDAGFYHLTHLPTGTSVYHTLDYDADAFEGMLSMLSIVPPFDLQTSEPWMVKISRMLSEAAKGKVAND